MSARPPNRPFEQGTAGGGAAFSRREALRLLAANITLGLAACGKPDEEIVPYVRMPERIVPGVPLRFATVLPLAGYGRGVTVTSIDGRPIKVEGNPRHPASLGATDVFAEASVLSLYDPDRSRTVLHNGEIASWDQLLRALAPVLQQARDRAGEGLRLLSGRITSPTLARQLDALLKQHPKAVWHAHEPAVTDPGRDGALIAFGRPLSAVPHLDRAEVVLTLDADPIGPGPDQIRSARGYGRNRAPRKGAMSRLYAVEATPTLTGAKADERLALPPPLIGEAAIAVANGLGAGLRAAALPERAARFVAAVLQDLQDKRGRALVLAGQALPPEVHALAHWINARLGAPVDLIEPIDHVAGREPASLADLARDLDAGAVDALVFLGSNPAYDAPADLDFAARMGKAAFRLHAGGTYDETAALSTWHCPQSHPLESWSDLRAANGTAAVMQPLIRPLYATRTLHEIVAALAGEPNAASYDLVRATWASQGGGDFERWWTNALHEGVVPDSAAEPVPVGEPRLPPVASRPPGSDGLTLVLRPDPGVWDGSFANNAWLQELPKPLTKQVWGNALGLGPADAGRLGLATGDTVRIEAGGRTLEAPIVVEPGHAGGVASLTLGYGRTRAGAVGTGVGANAFAIRTSASPWVLDGVGIRKTGRQPVLTTQLVVGAPEDVSRKRLDKLFPMISLAALARGRAPDLGTGPLPTLLPDRPRLPADHAWAMVIDTSACIGCNACVVACQAENNVPVVGPEEVARGRMMHWLRVDAYDHGTPERPKLGFQPVPCMHCEHAPCEPVCPVAASVHDGEGLNVQVYNRCVGTRFCEANCPYKVRRFNFFGYADGQEYANLGLEPYRAQKNPEVTVRTRGVMEKCTYCVQRISAARRAAERDDRPIGLDEVTTACQDACPTRAITFGDLLQDTAAVNGLKRDERHYALLGELGTRPRTTYLADLRNPNPGLDGDGA